MAHLLYTVQPSDVLEGLQGIARRLYGDERRWTALYEASRCLLGHNPTVLRPGQQLIVPAGEQEVDLRTSAAHVYVVQPVDIVEGLRGVARRTYGSPERWAEIYAVNCGTIGSDPQALQPGQRLIILA